MAVDPETAIVLYPEYFDLRLSRADGRRVAKKNAVEAPNAQTIYEAAKALGLDSILELDRHHPKFWYRASGRILVEPKFSKPELILKIVSRLRTQPRPK